MGGRPHRHNRTTDHPLKRESFARSRADLRSRRRWSRCTGAKSACNRQVPKAADISHLLFFPVEWDIGARAATKTAFLRTTAARSYSRQRWQPSELRSRIAAVLSKPSMKVRERQVSSGRDAGERRRGAGDSGAGCWRSYYGNVQIWSGTA